MGWFPLVLLVIEIIKLIMRLRDGDERTAHFTNLGAAMEQAASLGDRTALKRLRSLLKDRCRECNV